MLSGRHQVEFRHIFDKFKSDIAKDDKKEEADDTEAQTGDKKEKKEEKEPEKMSRKKLKELNQMKVSELKQAVARPDVVEAWDVTAEDPRFLVWLK